ncbi:glycosyltransferase family 4 protein [Actinoplanes sp. NBC_00393]|uniref:glycosyltransferase family 4 protein n=1 Tax=Actinoplanes sp. NBC_00393 TaxID=2975953 RepID=UPI002E1FA35B
MNPRLQIVTPVFPPAVGGIESLALGLADRWDGPVEILALEEPDSPEWDAAAAYPVHRVSNVPRGGRRAIARLTRAALPRARRFRPDIVLNMHVRCGYAAALAKLPTGAVWLQYYHAKEVPTWSRETRLCARRADQGIAVSRYTASLVRSVAPEAGPLTVIPPGIPEPAQVVGATRPDRPTLLTVARINDPYKGHDVVLDALPMIREKVPGVRWIVAGAGNRLGWLSDQVRTRGLGANVELLGLVDDSERDRLLATSDVFLLPSRTSPDGRAGEGFGIVYAEAAAAGLPIVAGDHGGVVDAVRDQVSGLLVNPADPRQVADAVIALLTDDARRARMSSAAQAWSEQFRWHRVARAFQELALSTYERKG